MLSQLAGRAFSLLGPYADWMTQTNGFRLPTDIGGPVPINEEYRWNVPQLSYAFDDSFLEYFGSNGVAAVDGAIQVLNDLPAASEMVLTNYPLDWQHHNYVASWPLHLLDLKTATLGLILEHLGLSSPQRNVCILRQWDPGFVYCSDELCWSNWAIPDFVLLRNYDPQTLAPSHFVNGYEFISEAGISAYTLEIQPRIQWVTEFFDIHEFLVDPFGDQNPALADWQTLDRWSLEGGFCPGINA